MSPTTAGTRLCLLLWCLLLAGGPASALTLELRANPTRVPADGTTTVTVTATVRDGGSFVDSGVNVVFATSAGDLLPIDGGGAAQSQLRVEVRGGRAQALLRATTYDTAAVVTAAIAEQPDTRMDRLTVLFGLTPDTALTYDNIIRVSAQTLRYMPEGDFMVMEAIGEAVLSYQGVEIRANLLQVDLLDYLVVAKDFRGATVALGPPPYKARGEGQGTGPPYTGESVVMDLDGLRGAIYSTRTGETTQFAGRTLTPVADPTPLQAGAFETFDLSGAKIWIEARRAAIYPNERIRFDRPHFYVQERKVLSLPYYFETLGYDAGRTLALSQMVSYSTQDGLIVDFPWYFDVSDRSTNEFRLTRGLQTGLFGRQSGWQVLYNHHGELPGDRGEFDFTVDQIGPDFGVNYTRSQRFGPSTYGTLSLAWPEHRNFFSNATLYTPAGPGSLSLSSNVDYLSGLSAGLTANANASWQTNPMRLSAIRGNLTGTVGLGYSHGFGVADRWRQTLAFSLSRDPWWIGRGGSIQPYAGLRFQNTINGNQEAAFTFNTSYRQELTPTMNVTFGYTYDTTWNSLFSIPDRHLLTLSWQMYKEDGPWNGYAFANYNLADRSLSASMLLDYSLSRHWGVQAQTVFQDSPVGTFHETEFWLSREIGARELRLRYNLERGRLFFEVDNNF